MVKIITLTIENIVSELLFDFCHHQVITKTYIHDNNEWKTTDTHILREWSLEKKEMDIAIFATTNRTRWLCCCGV